MACGVIWRVVGSVRREARGAGRDTPAAGADRPGLPGILTSMSVSACLGRPVWTTVNHNI